MGEAYNERGDVIGRASGQTRAEVFAALDKAHPDAQEIRVRSGEAPVAAGVDRAYTGREETRETTRRAGQVRPPGNGGALGGPSSTPGGPGGPALTGPAPTGFDPVQTLIDRVLSLPRGDRLRLAEAIAVATAKDLHGLGSVDRQVEALERELRERAEINRQTPNITPRIYHDRLGLIGEEAEEITLGNVDDLFTYGRWSKDQTQRGDVVRELLTLAAKGIIRNVPRGPGRDIALRNLMITRMVCNQAITFNGRI